MGLPQTVVQVPVAAPIPGQELPPQVTATQGSSTSSTQATPGAGVTEALDKATGEAGAQAQGVQDVAQAKADQRRAEAEGAGMRANEAQLSEIELQEATQRHQDRIARLVELADAEEQKYADYKFHDYFQDKDGKPMSLGLKIVGGLGVLFGGLAASSRGGRNTALETITKDIDRHFEQQKAELAQRESRAKMRRQGVADAMAGMDKELAAISMRQAKAKEAVAEKAVQMQLAAGVPLEQAMAVPEVHAIQRSAELDRVKALQAYDRHVTKEQQGSTTITGGGPNANRGPTESQAKQADLSAGMLGEIKTIEGLPTLSQDELAKVQNNMLAISAADRASGLGGIAGVRAGRAVGLIPRGAYEGLSPNGQKAMNAWHNLVELRARQLTGAGMPEEEARREATSLGYTPGDSPEVMQQKITRLRDAAQRGLQLSGTGGAIVGPGAAAPAAAAPDTLTRKEEARLMDFIANTPANGPRAQDVKDAKELLARKRARGGR